MAPGASPSRSRASCQLSASQQEMAYALADLPVRAPESTCPPLMEGAVSFSPSAASLVTPPCGACALPSVQAPPAYTQCSDAFPRLLRTRIPHTHLDCSADSPGLSVGLSLASATPRIGPIQCASSYQASAFTHASPKFQRLPRYRDLSSSRGATGTPLSYTQAVRSPAISHRPGDSHSPASSPPSYTPVWYEPWDSPQLPAPQFPPAVLVGPHPPSSPPYCPHRWEYLPPCTKCLPHGIFTSKLYLPKRILSNISKMLNPPTTLKSRLSTQIVNILWTEWRWWRRRSRKLNWWFWCEACRNLMVQKTSTPPCRPCSTLCWETLQLSILKWTEHTGPYVQRAQPPNHEMLSAGSTLTL